MNRKERTIATIGYDDRPYLFFLIPLVGFLIPLMFFRADLSEGLVNYLPEWAICTAYTAAYWLTVRQVFIQMRTRYPGYANIQKRIIYTILWILIAFFVIDYVMCYLKGLGGPHDERGVRNIDYTIASLTIITLCSAIYESIYLAFQWSKSIVEKEKWKRENIQSQLAGLKSQVNPHFLFNSLNTLTYIIPEDPDKAVKFVQKLSRVYRYILELRNKELISVEEELAFLDNYIFLLKERFGNNLHISIDIPEGYYHCQIVPLSLQILLENAIKHNIISSQKPLHIDIFLKDRVLLSIRNNLQLKIQKMPSTKVGLQNIKNRYSFFTDKEVEIEKTEDFFLVSIPILEVPELKSMMV